MHDTDGRNPGTDIGLRGLELFDEILKMIRENGEAWDQRKWAKVSMESRVLTEDEVTEYQDDLAEVVFPASCGTAYCVAGHAAHLTGAKILWTPDIESGRNEELDEYQRTLHGFEADTVVTGIDEDGDEITETISDYARRMLGLTWMDCNTLFAPENDEDDLLRIRNRWASGRALNGSEDHLSDEAIAARNAAEQATNL